MRIWAAPATLANYALLGWFIGFGRTDVGLVLQLVLNLTNVALCVLFVLGFGWGVRGVAAGTVLAEVIAAAIGLALALRHVRGLGARLALKSIVDAAALKRTFVVSADIMIRSLSLICVWVWFVAQGASQGDVILAANAVLMSFVTVAVYFLDGLAFAAEALVGRAVGAAHRAGLVAAAKLTTVWAAAVAVLVTGALLAARAGAHRSLDGRPGRASGGADLPLVGRIRAVTRRLVVSARRDLHRRDADGGDAQRDGRHARDLSRGLVAARAVSATTGCGAPSTSATSPGPARCCGITRRWCARSRRRAILSRFVGPIHTSKNPRGPP